MDNTKRGLCFDLDGTLLDSIKTGSKRIIDIAQKCNLPVEPLIEEKIKICWEKSIGKHQLASFLWNQEPPDKLEAFLALWEELDSAERYDIFPGTVETLMQLEKQFCLSVLTNRHAQSAVAQIKKNGLLPFFNFIIASDQVGVKKPDPKIMIPVFAKYGQAGISRENIILIGDTIEGDWQLAKAVGLEFFAVLAGGIHAREDFLKTGVPENHIINSITDLPALLLQKP